MFYFEVPSDNKLVDLVKQIKKGEMDIYLGLFLFSYQSISLFFHFISSCISSDCWKSQRQQLCGNVSTIYHEIGKLRTSPAVSAWFENVQYLAVAYLGVICNISEQQITIGAWIFFFAESHLIIPLRRLEYAVPDQTSVN